MKAQRMFAVNVRALTSFASWDDRVEPYGPTWTYAHEMLRIHWKNAGGDWIDADGVKQGPKPFVAANIVTAPADGDVISWSGPGMLALAKALLARNTGIYLKASGSQNPYLWSREAPANYPKPVMNIVTSTGTFSCECIADTWLSSSTDSYLGAPPPMSPIGSDHFRMPAALKFDLGAVTGEPQSAEMRITSSYPNPDAGYSIGASILDMPDLITAPALVFPDRVEQGLAAQVEIDTDLGKPPFLYHKDTNPDGPILYYTDFSSKDELSIWGPLQDNAGWEMNNMIYPDGTGGEMTFHRFEEYGLWAGRYVAKPTRNSIVTAARIAWPENINPHDQTWRKPYDELYFRYLVKIGDNAPEGTRNSAVKMPGMGASYNFASPVRPFPSTSVWDGRMEHGWFSIVNRAAWWILHYYGADHTIHNQGALGFNMNIVEVSQTTEQIYSIEEHVKLNTPKESGGWNPNAIFEIFFDGVKCFRIDDRLVRNDANANFGEVPHFNIYSGGSGPAAFPTGPIDYTFSGICCSRKYIGPPKKVTA